MTDKISTAVQSLPLRKPNEEEWRALCAKWEMNKIPQKQFCAEHQINYQHFVFWRSKILKEKGLSRANRFVPVKVTSGLNAANTQIRLQLSNNMSLHISTEVSEPFLRTLFSSLGVFNA